MFRQAYEAEAKACPEESPSVVTGKFPSDMTRARFLGYDACPRLFWCQI